MTGAKLYLTNCKGICVPIFAQLLFRDVNFPVAMCLGQVYLFYKLVSLIDFSKFALMKKNQHFLSNSSYYIYQKHSVVKFQCLFLVRYSKISHAKMYVNVMILFQLIFFLIKIHFSSIFLFPLSKTDDIISLSFQDILFHLILTLCIFQGSISVYKDLVKLLQGNAPEQSSSISCRQ